MAIAKVLNLTGDAAEVARIEGAYQVPITAPGKEKLHLDTMPRGSDSRRN